MYIPSYNKSGYKAVGRSIESYTKSSYIYIYIYIHLYIYLFIKADRGPGVAPRGGPSSRFEHTSYYAIVCYSIL